MGPRLRGDDVVRCGLRVLLFTFALLLLGSALSPLWAAETIAAIEITGNRTVDTNAIRSQLKLAQGSPYDAAKADQSIKALFATGLFAHVGIDRRGTTLVVKVAENPIVAGVYLEGNAAIDKAKLEEQIQLKPRTRYTAARAHADAVRLRDAYRHLGRLATAVEPSVVYQSDGRVEVTYVVKEGEVTKVDSIGFVGNRAFTAGQLRDVISTSQSGWFDILKSAAFYDPERLNQDKDLLRRHYLKQGFPDARVVSAEAVKNPEGTGYVITFTVEEGERFTFAPAIVETKLRGADPDKLRDLVAVKPGGAYSQEAIEKSVEKMTLALSDAGLAFAQVKPMPKRDNAGHTIAIAFRVEEGPRIYVERIDIVGNRKTKDFVIRREFRVAEGDAVNALMIERGRKRVQALGFFKSVSLKKQPGSAPDKVAIIIDVVEDQTIDFGIGVGYSTSEGVVGDISIAERNLFGNGQWLRLEDCRQPNALSSRGRLHRAALPRYECRRRLRPVLQGRRLYHPGLLQEPADRRRRARALSPQRRVVGRRQLHVCPQQDLRRRHGRFRCHQGRGAGFSWRHLHHLLHVLRRL